MTPVRPAPECNQTYLAVNIELEYVAAIIESLVPIWRPLDMLGPNGLGKVSRGHAEIAFALLLSIENATEGIGNLTCIQLGCKSRSVTAPVTNASLDRIERTCQHRRFGFAYAITAAFH